MYVLQLLRPVILAGGGALLPKVFYPYYHEVKRAPMEWTWMYRMHHCRTSSELVILLRILEHCLDIPSMQPQGAYPVIRDSRPARDYRYAKEYEVAISPHDPPEWYHEDDVDLWAIRTYGHHVVYVQKRSEVQKAKLMQQRVVEEKKKVGFGKKLYLALSMVSLMPPYFPISTCAESASPD